MQGVLFAYIVCSFFGSIEYQWFLYYPVAYAIALRRIHGTEQSASVAADKYTIVVDRKAAGRRGVIWERPSAASRALAARARS
jgi:hypothetical protein